MELRYEISDRPDASLVRAVLAGEPEAFNVLVRRWERKIYSYLVHLTGCREEAFDLCQEVFIASYRNLPQLEDSEKFRHWLFRIAHNKANAHTRAARPQHADLQELDPAAAPSVLRVGDQGRWEHGELGILVEQALAELPVEQREAIVLKFYQGFKLAEIAEIQGCPLSTAKTRLYSAFEHLKKFIETQCGGSFGGLGNPNGL